MVETIDATRPGWTKVARRYRSLPRWRTDCDPGLPLSVVPTPLEAPLDAPPSAPPPELPDDASVVFVALPSLPEVPPSGPEEDPADAFWSPF
jgi:hypothetical protein